MPNLHTRSGGRIYGSNKQPHPESLSYVSVLVPTLIIFFDTIAQNE